MKGIELPPRTEDFTADPVELFFDLAYVFAFSQLVGLIVHDPTWSGIGAAAMLFVILWLPWQQLTWAANAVSGNGRPIRLIFLAATALSVPMAAATSTAFTTGGPTFAISLAGIMGLGFAIQLLGVERGTDFGSAVVRWIAPTLIAILVLLIGGAVEGSMRVGLWAVTLAIVFGAMVAAGRGQWIIRVGHMAERHALIVIVALGEVIVAIGLPVVSALEEGQGLPAATVAALVASGVFAGLLWWGYFDRINPGLEHAGNKLTSDQDRGRYVRDVYSWTHVLIVAGIILSAAALEEISLHPEDPVETAFRWMLLSGIALISIGVTTAVWRAYRFFTAERLITAVAVAAVILAGASLRGLTLLALVVAVMFISLLIEHSRAEGVNAGR